MLLNLRTQSLLEKYQLRKSFVKPAFSYQSLNISTQSYALTAPEVDLQLAAYGENGMPRECYTNSFNILRDEKYANYMHLYADGSENERGVRAAVVWRWRDRKATLPREASIYSAELYAITMALNVIAEAAEVAAVVFSDSYSALRALGDIRNQHPVVRKIMHDIDRLRVNGSVVRLCWVMSRVGIVVNERADKAAVSASFRQEEYRWVCYRYFYPGVYRNIMTEWNREWQMSNGKMEEVKKWKNIETKDRRVEVVINKLRSGHSLQTHGYLMDDNEPDVSPICEGCPNAVLSIKYILLQCLAYHASRRKMKAWDNRRNVALSEIVEEKKEKTTIVLHQNFQENSIPTTTGLPPQGYLYDCGISTIAV